jgi:hypothetical protein
VGGIVSATTPAARTRPKLLIAVGVVGAAAALGMHFLGGGSDGPTTIGQLAGPARAGTATADETATPTVTTADPTTTVPASTTTTGATAATAATAVPGATLSTIPWTTGADGTRREPFTFTPAPAEETAAGVLDDTAGATSSDGTADAASVAGVPVPTAIGTSTGSSATDDDGSADDAVDGATDGDTEDTTTTVPAETTTTRSPTLGLVTRPTGGYWLFQADGSVYASREDTWYGDLRSVALTTPVVGMQATSTGKGYYLVSRDGGVFAFGDAVYDGSIPETLARQLESLLDDGYLAPTTTTTTPPLKHR